LRLGKQVTPHRLLREKSELYKSTYTGEAGDSDDDEFHITMPFKHSDELHQDVLFSTKFESDEDYTLEDDEEKGKFLDVLDTIQDTIQNLTKNLDPTWGTDFSYAE